MPISYIMMDEYNVTFTVKRKIMNKNRYGDEWYWEKIAPDQYKFIMSGDGLEYGRVGGKVGQSGIDMQDLGMFDPSGGPYVSCRGDYPGTMIEGKEIIHIGHEDGHYVVTVEEKEDA
jgi:hypothetical protein